ncbi:replication factor C small subunit [Nitzschia inconspicua]|uniref:Replication factor C small subunit n=1 Tax=Nitzschia inconspicua TaxID=303405 RepID=A0A9K3PEH2_9STRA|nr:replication factor C small subunit [Nitzschia inconspicua]
MTSMEIDSSYNIPAASSLSSTVDGTPWVERYRPKTLKDVSHQTEVVQTLQNAVQTGRLPHLLLYGPPGSGKTSVALALCKELWHPSQLKRRVLELNASDERGISVVREKIKQFASLSVGSGAVALVPPGKKSKTGKNDFFGTTKENTINGGEQQDTADTGMEVEERKYPNPPFKIIILDEADTVTPDAQAALRRIIEAHSRITRFILICNYVTRIIEPLASRCAKFRFQALPSSSMKERLTSIARAEGITDQQLSGKQMDDILNISGGDMRRAVTSLQSVQALLAGDPKMEINEATLAELSGQPPNHVVQTLYQSLLDMKFETMQNAVKRVVADGYSVQMLLTKLLDKITDSEDLDELGKARLAIRIAEAEDRMNDGADEELQLMTVCGLALECLQSAQRKREMS